jgi:hypothetical protein
MTINSFPRDQLLAALGGNMRLAMAFEEQALAVEETAGTVTATASATGEIAEASPLLLSASLGFANGKVLKTGTGIALNDAGGEVTLSVSDEVPTVVGDRTVQFYATGDTDLVLPESGTLATVVDVEAIVGAIPFPDGDYGDIIVSGDGMIWEFNGTINNNDWAGADLEIANGGTGASSPAAARSNLALLSTSENDARYAPIRSGAKVTKAANQTGLNFTAGLIVNWESEAFDDANWHDTAVNTSRLAVPAGVTRVRVGATVRMSNSTAGSHTITILKNGATNVASSMVTAAAANALNVTGLDACTPGDYYEVNVFVNDASADITAAGSSFWIEAA